MGNLGDAAAIGHWHEAPTRNIGNRVEGRPLGGCGGGDIEQDEFVDFLVVEDLDRVDGVANILGRPECSGLDQTALAQQQGGAVLQRRRRQKRYE